MLAETDLLLALGDHRHPHAAMQTQLQLLYAAVDQVRIKHRSPVVSKNCHLN